MLRQRLRAMHTEVAQFVLLDQLNEVCLQFEQEQLKTLGDGVEKALKAKNGGAEAGAALIHQAIESIGMKPVTVVKAEDDDMKSTSSGAESEELDPEEIKRRAEAAKKAEEDEKEAMSKCAKGTQFNKQEKACEACADGKFNDKKGGLPCKDRISKCPAGDFLETKDKVLLVMDTEGLLSVEARDDVFDKQVALMTMACSHLVLINNRGELGRQEPPHRRDAVRHPSRGRLRAPAPRPVHRAHSHASAGRASDRKGGSEIGRASCRERV